MSAQDLLVEYLNSPSPSASLYSALELTFANADSSTANLLISAIKQTIKQRKLPPSQKLRALQALVTALDTNNAFVRGVVCKKVLSRLIKIARTRSNLKHEARGAVLFGEQSVAAERKASADFLSLLMNSIRKWAHRFGQMPECGGFSRAYHVLVREKLPFPREAKIQRELCIAAAETMEHLLAAALPDPAEITKAVELLKQQAKIIDHELKDASQKRDLQPLNEVMEIVERALQQYGDWVNKSAHCSAPAASALKVDISRIPQSRRQLATVREPRGLPEPGHFCDSEEEFGFDFESDIHAESHSRKLQFQWDDEAEARDLRAELEEARSQAAYLQEKVTEYLQCLETQERMIARKDAEIMDVQRHLAGIDVEKVALADEIANLKAQLAPCEKEVRTSREALKSRNADEGRRMQQHEEQLQQLRLEVTSRQQKLESLLREKTELSGQVAASAGQEKELQMKVAESQALEKRVSVLQSMTKELAEVREQTKGAEKEIRQRENQANEGRKLEAETEQLKTQISDVERENTGLNEQIESVQSEIEELEVALKSTLQEIEAVEKEQRLTRAENARRVAEDIASRLSLSPLNAVPAKCIESLSSTLTLSRTMAEPTYPKVAMPDSDGEIDESEEVKASTIANDSCYYKCLFLSNGLLYSSSSLQVGFQRAEASLLVTVCNCCESSIENLSMDIVDAPSGLEMEADELPREVEASARVTVTYSLRCTKEFSAPPKLDATFSQNKTKMRLLLKLPIGILHFCSPLQSQTDSLQQLWTDLSPFETTRSFRSLHSFLRSMRDVAGVLNIAGLLVHGRADWLEPGCLLATGKVLGREAAVAVCVHASGNGGHVSVRGLPIRLRECAVNHVLQLLSPAQFKCK